MLGVVRVGLCFSLLCSVLACARASRDAALIRVDVVEQALERSDELLLRGDGFPPGMRGEARLRGALYPVGRPPVAIDLRTPCRALGAQKARVELDALHPQLAGEGPFEGSVEVRFGSHDDAQLVGRSERALFRLGATPPIEEQFAASQRAQRFQRAIGIEALEQSEAGLRVAEITRGSAAANAGLAQHDVVLRMDGRPIQLGRDLIRLADESVLALEVRAPRGQTVRLVRVASRTADERPLFALTALALLLGVGLGAVLASALPTHLLWAPRRREYWLLSCCALCAVWLGALIVRDLDPLLPRMGEALLFGAVGAASIVYLRRRLSPTLRTKRDSDLAPLL
jgi:hypothetical protein